MLIYPNQFSRHEKNPTVAANTIREALNEHASTLGGERGSKLREVVDAIFDDCPYQDMGQSLLNQIMGYEEAGMMIFDLLMPVDRFHAISAGYAHDAILAAKHGYSDPWPLVAHSMYWLSMAATEDSYDELVRNIRASDARRRANLLHDKPGGSREKQKKIREIWASGKYISRDICAEQECAALDMSFSAARKALRGVPAPT